MAFIEALIFGWLGAITLFLTTVSPTVFASLDQEQSSRFLRAYFPRLFSTEAIVGFVIIVLSIYISATGGLFINGFSIGLLVIFFALINLKLITPQLNDATDKWIEDKCKRTKRRFIILHALSVGLFGLNALAMILLIIL